MFWNFLETKSIFLQNSEVILILIVCLFVCLFFKLNFFHKKSENIKSDSLNRILHW